MGRFGPRTPESNSHTDPKLAAIQHGPEARLARVISDGATVCYVQDLLVHPDAQRTGVGRTLMLAVLKHFAGVRQKVLLTDDEPGQRVFYESVGFRETRDHGVGSLRAFVRFAS